MDSCFALLGASPHCVGKICNASHRANPPAGGVLPYIGYIGLCGPKGYGFSAVLVINKVSILVDFGHFGHK